MREFEIKPELEKKLKKLSIKSPNTYTAVLHKIEEIVESKEVEHYKNLRNKLKRYKRVHVGHFVLLFTHNSKNNIVTFLDFDHHDKIY